MSRYLVTGGTGFIGAALVKRLVADGHQVRVLDNDSRGRRQRLAGLDVEIVVGDIRSDALVRGAVANVDSVVHLAYVNGTRFFYEKPGEVLDIGIRGTLNVLDACKTAGVPEFILASTSEVYQTPPVVPTPETVALTIPDVRNPRYSYGGGKIAAELLALHSGLERVVIFRPHNVYGPDMGREHVIPEFVERMAALPPGTPFKIHGTGEQTRAFVHIDDFTEALVRVLARGEHREIYHLGNPEQITIRELALLIADRMGRYVEILTAPAPAGETPVRCPDITKVRALGFEPKIPLVEGIGGVVQWYLANRAQH